MQCARANLTIVSSNIIFKNLSLVPANIIRSRDNSILIRVDKGSHDSLQFANRAYAAKFSRILVLN